MIKVNSVSSRNTLLFICRTAMFVRRALLSLVLSVVCVFGGGHCPTGCDCDEKMYSVSCSNGGFENIPVSMPYYVKVCNVC